MGTFRVFQGNVRWNFSAVKTAWRRGRDSNPRYPFGYAGFQDRSHQPLGHLSDGSIVCEKGLVAKGALPSRFLLVYNTHDESQCGGSSPNALE
jgi:hypothetical protein